MLAFVSITELSILDWSCKFLMSDGLSNKVFVLALDGATFDLIRPWAEQGKLPLFSKLMAESAWGELNSTIPPITPVAWLTFMTGKNPGKHGVFNFFRPIRNDYAAVTPASATVNTESTLWELLSQRGRNVAILNVPMTYPPKPVNGSLFAGVPMPTGEMQFSYPPGLHEELMSHGWDLRKNASFSQGTYEGFLDYLKELVVMRTDATLYLMKNRPWDFFMIHHFETDQVAHMYWRFMENEAESHPLHNAMLQLFQCVEEQMARIIQALPQETSLLMLSDHGVGPVHCHLHLNNWLINEGFMHWKSSWSTKIRRIGYQIGLNPTNLYRRIPEAILQRLTLGQTRAEMARVDREVRSVGGGKSLVRQWFSTLMRMPFLYLNDIDWSKSVAYSGDTTQCGMIYLNVAGREPQGIVNPGIEYVELRERIRERLLRWMNPITGTKMVERVSFREDVYSGHQLESAPDIVIYYNEHDYESRKGALFLSHREVEPVKNAFATHRQKGMVLVHGSAIVPGEIQKDIDLMDLPSLILYLLNEEIPKDFEGRLPVELIDPSTFVQLPPRFGDATALSSHEHGSPELSADDNAIILEQLRRLGYIE